MSPTYRLQSLHLINTYKIITTEECTASFHHRDDTVAEPQKVQHNDTTTDTATKPEQLVPSNPMFVENKRIIREGVVDKIG